MEREIFCDECGHCAIEVDAQAAGTDLDGIHCVCQGCNVDGKIIYLDDGDEGGPYSWLKFRKLTEDEESELASLVCDGRDEVEIEVDRMFQETDVRELAALLIRDGWLDKWMSQQMGELDDPSRSAVTKYIDRCIVEHTGPGLAKCGPKKSDLPN